MGGLAMTRREGAKQRTPKGYEIPVPKREDVMTVFRKVAGQRQDRNQATKPKP